MRAAVMYAPGDVRVEDRPAPAIEEPTDATVRIVRTCICGSDLHPYHSMEASQEGARMGHEMIGVVEQVGDLVFTVKPGDLVIAPFAFSDNTCDICLDGFQTACPHGGFFSTCQSEMVRVPQADGTLVVLEAVGLKPAYEQSYGVVRSGGVISRVGVPQYEDAPVGFMSLFGRNITLTGGPAPVRAYLEQGLKDVTSGLINPGQLFDVTLPLDEAPKGYELMDSRKALKVMLKP